TTSPNPCGRQSRATTRTRSTTMRPRSTMKYTKHSVARTPNSCCTCVCSALVEEAGVRAVVARRHVLLAGDLDVLGREQEHLVGDALDRTAEAEDQAGREVDETLGVRIVHVGEVDDDGRARAERLTDDARVVVR